MVMRVVMVLLMVCTIAAGAALHSSRSAAPPQNPFAPYADLLTWEGAWLAFQERKFLCQETFSSAASRCTYPAENDYFAEIYVVLVDNFPSLISFDINRPALRLGDLIALWGMPELLPPRGRVDNLYWAEQHATAGISVLSNSRPDYHAPVYSVTFTFE